MPVRILPYAMLLGTSTALAENTPSLGWREALAREIEASIPPPTPPVEISSPLRPGVPLPEFEDDDPDLVPLPLMTIAAQRNLRDLDEGIASTYRRVRAREWSLLEGGPIIERDFGKIRFTVHTGPEQPFMISLSW